MRSSWDKLVDRNKIDDVISHVVGQPYYLKKNKKLSNILSEMANQIEAKLYRYDRLSMRNK